MFKSQEIQINKLTRFLYYFKYFLPSLFFSFTASADDLTLLFYKAPKKLDWTSPSTLARTTIHNSFFENRSRRVDRDGKIVRNPKEFSGEVAYDLFAHPNPISHVDVLLNCEPNEIIYTGSGRVHNSDEAKLALKGQLGLEVLLKEYPGRLIEKEEILDWLDYFKSKGEVNFLKIKISRATCARLTAYQKEYVHRGYHKKYAGFLQDPLKGEGAGCAAFGFSFLRVGGLIEPAFEQHWRRMIRIPKRFINYFGLQSEKSLFNFLVSDYSWATESEPHVLIEPNDPELMYEWVAKLHNHNGAHSTNGLELVTDKKSLGVILDRRSRPTPKSPIFAVPPPSR